MAYAIECPHCGGMVDNNEFDYRRKVCKDCADELEQEEVRQASVNKMMNSACEQMVLEV